jgi:hypothetical protein
MGCREAGAARNRLAFYAYQSLAGAHNAALPGQWFFTIGRGMLSGERLLRRGVKENRLGARSHAQAKTCPFWGRPG